MASHWLSVHFWECLHRMNIYTACYWQEADPNAVPVYDLLRIQLKGYDFAVLESFARYVHNISDTFGLDASAWVGTSFITHNSSYCCSTCHHRNSVCQFVCFVHLSVRPSHQSKMVQARITKSSPSAAWKTLVSGTVKLFDKFEVRHTKRRH